MGEPGRLKFPFEGHRVLISVSEQTSELSDEFNLALTGNTLSAVSIIQSIVPIRIGTLAEHVPVSNVPIRTFIGTRRRCQGLPSSWPVPALHDSSFSITRRIPARLATSAEFPSSSAIRAEIAPGSATRQNVNPRICAPSACARSQARRILRSPDSSYRSSPYT